MMKMEKTFSRLAIGDIFSPYSDGNEQFIKICCASTQYGVGNAVCLADGEVFYFEDNDPLYLVNPHKRAMEE
jgi:hypothetical protein